MLEVLQYGFMQRAIIASILISASIPFIGTVIVLKRLSTMGDALSHTSLAGVAIGLVAGFSPLVAAIIISIIASLAIEYIIKAFPKYSEIGVNVILSSGVGLAAVFSGFIKNSVNFNSFLFGSLVSIGESDIWLIAALGMTVILFNILLFKELLSITMDEEAAELSGIPINIINLLFSVITAVTVSIAARTVGALIVSSLIVIPAACALLLARSYKQTVLFSMMFALTFTLAGLFCSYYFNLRPGGSIVLIGVVILFILIAAKRLKLFTN